MEFRQLHTFIQAAQLQSFSRAGSSAWLFTVGGDGPDPHAREGAWNAPV